jgi:hypothetical protein
MIKEEEKEHITSKYGGGVLTYEACNAFAIACLTYEEAGDICKSEVFDWCYTNLGWVTHKKTVIFKSEPLNAAVTVKQI